MSTTSSPVGAATLVLDDVGVDFPFYQSKARSLKRVALRATIGGLIGVAGDTGRTSVRALDGISLDIRAGDRVALLGHNGAGKTTLLRVLAGIYHPSAGTFRHHGHRVPLFDIGLGLDDEASGYDNIYLRGLVMGATRRELDRRRDDIAAFSGLGDFLDLPIRTYSSGMLVRLLFSIATSVEADILLLDEWLSAGDQAFVEKANRRLHELIDRAHILVLASHDLALLRSVCNRAVLLEHGRIKRQGPVEEVIAVYAAGG